jgi:RNA polymerase sigma factor (sigma-70 family)
MNEQTDSQLLRAYAQSRSEAAFGELVRRQVDFVYSAALRMVCDPHLAEDVTQGVFIALAKNAKGLVDRPVLSGWLHRTAQNIAAKTVRSSERRRAREQEAAAMSELLSAESDIPWEHIAPHLDAALGELSEPDRDVLLLRYFERRSAREIGATLGISDEAAQKRVNRAVERLRDVFAKRGVTIGASGLVILISANAVQSAPVGLALAISTAAFIAGATSITTATATQAITMTTLQKTIVAAALAVAVGAGIYEAKQAADARAQARTFQRQQAALADQVGQLQKERDEATNRLAAIGNEAVRAKADTGELLKLRGEVGRLRNELAQKKGNSTTEPIAFAGKELNRLMMAKQKAAWTNDALEEIEKMKEKLGLSAEQERAIRQIWLANIDPKAELMVAQTEGADHDGWKKQFEKLYGEEEQAIKAVLDSNQQAAYKQLKKDEDKREAETQAKDEAYRMRGPLGLTAEQTRQVTSILLGLSRQKGGLSDLTDREEVESRLRALASVLTPAQQEIYRQTKLKEIERETELMELFKKGVIPLDVDGL